MSATAAGDAPVRAAMPLSSPGQVVDAIVRGLYTGRYAPGQRLIEADLVREYKVGRGTIREALQRLAAEGVVSLNLHRGAYVRVLSRSETRDVFAVIEALTGLAARLAAERVHDRGNTALMREAMEGVASAADGDYVDYVQARNRFYRRLVGIGGNRELHRILPTLHIHLLRTQFRRHGGATERRRIEEYARIAEAVDAADPDAAERAMRAHVRRTATLIQELPGDAFAPDGNGLPDAQARE